MKNKTMNYLEARVYFERKREKTKRAIYLICLHIYLFCMLVLIVSLLWMFVLEI